MNEENSRDYLNTDLPLKKRIKNLVAQLTVEEKIGLIPTRQAAIPRLNIKAYSIGNEVARGYVPHDSEKTGNSENSTVFPQPIGLASMFDTELLEKLGEIAGTELRYYEENTEKNHLVLFGPTVDLSRDPRWGRNEECYGEDPYLAGQSVKAYTKGIVGNNPDYFRAVPSLKHFFANNNEENRSSSSSNIDPRTKYEYYYRAFRPAIEAGYAAGVMTAYNSVNGLPALLNPDLDKVCKKQWGMKYALTDGGDMGQTVTHHHFTKNHAKTIAMALKSGTDLMCDDPDLVTDSLRYAMDKGMLTEKDLDKAVVNALYPRFLLGEFNPPENNPYLNLPESVVNSFKYKVLNLQAAREAITLLKNKSLLPLKTDRIKKLAVLGVHGNQDFRDWYTGTSSYSVTMFDAFKGMLLDAETLYDDCRDIIAIRSLLTGKYLKVNEDGSITADGDSPDSEECRFIKDDWGSEIVLTSVKNQKYISAEDIYRANETTVYSWFVKPVLKPSAVNGAVIYRSWNDKAVYINEDGKLAHGEVSRIEENQLFSEEIVDDGIMRGIRLASSCDYAVVCVGNNPMIVARECYDRKKIELPFFQNEFVKNIYMANRNTVMCLISSYPYAIPELDRQIPAIIYTAHGGPEMGTAIAETILGKNNPAGRTPVTWYGSTEELAPITDYDIIKTKSTYLYYDRKPLYPFGYGLSYSHFRYGSLKVIDNIDTVDVSVTVENLSALGGDEVVQIYISELDSRYKRPIKQLCGFKREFIDPIGKKVFSFTVDKKEFGRWDAVNNEYCFDEGMYRIFAGGSSEDDECSATIFLTGSNPAPRSLDKKLNAVCCDEKNGVELRTTSCGRYEYIAGTNTFGGKIVFYDCDFGGCRKIKVKASTNGNASKIFFAAEGENIAELSLPPFVEPEKFKTFDIPLTKEIEGVHDLTVHIREGVNILSMKLISDNNIAEQEKEIQE